MKKLIYVSLLLLIVVCVNILIHSSHYFPKDKIWHVASDGTGNRTQGTTWASAINWDTLKVVLETALAMTAGDTFYVKGGTYTFTAAIDFSTTYDGTGASPNVFIGVKSATTNEGAAIVYSDWAVDSASRPFFDCATFTLTPGDYTIFRNFNFSGEATRVVYLQTACLMENCDVTQDYASSIARYCVTAGSGSSIISCHFQSPHGAGLALLGYNRVLYCRLLNFPDATNGKAIVNGGNGNVIIGNIIGWCGAEAINSTADHYLTLDHNTIKYCTRAVYATTDAGWVLTNNIIDSMTTAGAEWTTQENINYWSHNHIDSVRNNNTPLTLVSKGPLFGDNSKTTGDPGLGTDFINNDTTKTIWRNSLEP